MYRINLVFEWGGGTLWAANEAARARYDLGDLSEVLPVSEATRDRLAQMTEWHDRSLNRDYPPDPGPWTEAEHARFARAADEILTVIRAELGPEFEVVYRG